MRTSFFAPSALLRLVLLLVVSAATFLLPASVYAQVTPEQGAEIRTQVLGAVGNPTQIQGLAACTTGAVPGFIQGSGLGSSMTSASVGALIALQYCGERATTNGSMPGYSQVTYQEGDILKCHFHAQSLARPSCVVTRPDGGQFFFSDFFLGGNQSATFNAQGEFVGGQEQSVGREAGQSVIDLAEDAATLAVRAVAKLILLIATFLLGIAGTLLNWVMVKAVFEFSLLIGNSPGLLLAWSILRDIGNMILLFGFIFVGIAIILGIDRYDAKHALPRLIIFAVLMNFSLFAAEAIIDASNGLTSVLYNQANTNPCANSIDISTGTVSQEDCSINHGLAGHIMQTTGLSGIYAVDDSSGLLPNAAAMIGLALFATIGCVVIFATALMLITRAVVLTFLMITSPIGFAGMAIPSFEKYAKDWWSRLIHQAFFAPVLILMIFLSLKITSTFADTSTRGSLAAAVTHPEASVMGVIMVFALVIGFLIGSLVIARKMGAMGANFAINSAGKVTGAVVMGGTAYVGRQTIGRGSEAAAKRILASDFAKKRPNLARMSVGVLDRGAKSSFDARATRPIKSGSKAIDTDFGKPGKTASKGYRGSIEEKVKARDEFEKRVTPTKDEKGTGDELGAELEELRKKQREYLDSSLKDIQEHQRKVTEARKKGNTQELEAARELLREKIKIYEEKRSGPQNPYNEIIGRDADDNPIRRGKYLEDKSKEWTKFANQEKTRVFIEEGLRNRWYNRFPGTPSREANEIAREKIRKDRSTDDLQKALKKIAEGNNTPPPAAPPTTP